MNIRKISLTTVAAGCLLCCGLAFASSGNTPQIPEETGIQGFISRLTSISPEMGRLAEDINHAYDARCGRPLTVPQAETLVRGSSDYAGLLQKMMSDSTYTSGSDYRDGVQGIADVTCQLSTHSKPGSST